MSTAHVAAMWAAHQPAHSPMLTVLAVAPSTLTVRCVMDIPAAPTDDEEERRIWGKAAAKPKGYKLSMEDGFAWREDDGSLLHHHKSEKTGIEYTSKVDL